MLFNSQRKTQTVRLCNNMQTDDGLTIIRKLLKKSQKKFRLYIRNEHLRESKKC